MEKLNIEPTTDSPLIQFNPDIGSFKIEGKSYPEDTVDLYLPVIEWLDEYIENPLPKTTLSIKLDYFNSSSYKALLNIMMKLEQAKTNSSKVFVEWHYSPKDKDMKEAGEEFEELVELPFVFVERG